MGEKNSRSGTADWPQIGSSMPQICCCRGIHDGIFVLKGKVWHFGRSNDPEELAITAMDREEANHCAGGHMEEDGQKIGPKGAQKGLPTAFIDQKGVDHEFGIEIAESNFGAKSHGRDWEMEGENWNWGEITE